MIARASDLQTPDDILNRYGVYLNDYSLYFIDIMSPNSGGYRNVIASVPLEHMIIADRDYQQISRSGKCCYFLSGGSGIKYFGMKDMKELAQSRGIRDYQNKVLDSDLRSIVISKGNTNLFKSMLCL